jgi:hypothetical protein
MNSDWGEKPFRYEVQWDSYRISYRNLAGMLSERLSPIWDPIWIHIGPHIGVSRLQCELWWEKWLLSNLKWSAHPEIAHVAGRGGRAGDVKVVWGGGDGKGGSGGIKWRQRWEIIINHTSDLDISYEFLCLLTLKFTQLIEYNHAPMSMWFWRYCTRSPSLWNVVEKHSKNNNLIEKRGQVRTVTKTSCPEPHHSPKATVWLAHAWRRGRWDMKAVSLYLGASGGEESHGDGEIWRLYLFI